MLNSIHLMNVGPASEMRMDFEQRLNLITGDNGLGKSFLLDVAWWALTRTWAREIVIPKPRSEAKISYAYTKKTKGLYNFSSTYDPTRIRWSVTQGRPAIPGLILYAQVDGGFSVWDPTRNYWTEDALDRPNAFLFSPEQVWKGNDYCSGVLSDWALWQAGNHPAFLLLKQVLQTLSPSETEQLTPGEPRLLKVNDKSRTPTLRMPYGEDVALIHASAGMRRIIALAYLLTWAWDRHVESATIREETPAREIVFLIDEIEAHLHPQWQRRIVPALLRVMDALTGQHDTKVQVIAATHSPLVLASMEPIFDPDKDAWFDLDLVNGQAALKKRPFVSHGEVGNWLVSDAFDLKEPRSVEGERAIAAAHDLLHATSPSIGQIRAADLALRNAGLPDIDPFWVRWGFFVEQNKASKGDEISSKSIRKRSPQK